MNILIFGSGFIGCNLGIGFHESEYHVTAVDKIPVNAYFKTYKRNIKHKVDDIFIKEKPEVVFYTINSRLGRGKNPLLYYIQADVYDFMQVLVNCVKYKVKKIIFVSSLELTHDNCSECNSLNKFKLNPIDNRLINFFTNEMYLQHMKNTYGLDFVSLRIPQVYGFKPFDHWSDNMIQKLVQSGIKKKELNIKKNIEDGEHLIYIGDVVSSLIHSMRQNISGIYNVLGNYHTYGEIMSTVGEFMDLRVNFTEPKVNSKKKDAFRMNLLENHDWKPIVSLYAGTKAIIDQYQKNRADMYFRR